MSKRITLSIPDNLHKQLAEWRESFNLSRVFQEAVVEILHRKQAVRDCIQDDLPQVIARLKREKQEIEGRWFQTGVNAGLQWARSAHWLELKQIIAAKTEYLTTPGNRLQDYLREVLKTEERKLVLQAGIEDFRTVFLEGWLKGVRDFWSMVNDKI